MIFGIALMDWLLVFGLIGAFIWICLYFGFLTGLKSPVDISMYFRAMFKAFNNSELRTFWKYLILAIEYIIGMIIAGFIKSAWYPSQWTKKFINFALFGKKKKDRLEREKLADRPKKIKDNGGVY